jgi:hypothetical protein
MYMAVVSVAIVLSFHLKHKATEIELRMAKPLGAIFWCLSVASLCLGLANYISMDTSSALILYISVTDHRGFAVETVNKYSRRAAIVQTGWKTQSVRLIELPLSTLVSSDAA